ncbi:MAG: PKD domain-containing protein, partial [Nitrospiraceae bacterium]|nr:PKD domain-containing protein [Nitrospiraceae bacterium]
PRLELAPDVEGVRGTVYTFGSDPAFAAKAGATITEVLIENGLLVMPTGFPGGGGNRGPKRPGALLTPRPHYIERDGLPFRKAIESGAPLMLVSNTLVPTLAKASAPASLSTSVMRGLLRGEMGFDGVVVAGPMDSPEITRLHTPTDAALLAFEAGTDMIFWNAPGPHVMKAVELIVLAVNKGRVKEADIDKALTRVLELKRSHNLLEHPMPDTRKAAALEKKRKNFDDAYLIERRSVTVVSNRGGVLPLTNTTASVPLGVTGVAGVEELYDVLRKHLKPVAQQPIMTASHLGRIEDFEIYRLTSHVEGMKTAVCVLTDMRSVEGQVTLIRELHAKGVRVVIVLLGYPHNLAHLREADAIVVAYCDDSTDCAATMKAVGEALIGQGPVRILEVERDLPVTVGKAETFDIANIVWTPPGRLPVTIDEPFVAGYAVPMNPAPAAKKVEWDFGDGKRAKGAQAEHTYATPGRYTLGLTVTDHHGDVTSGTFSIVAE